MYSLVSTYVVCERLSVMHKQVSVQLTSNSKFLSKFSRKPLSGISDQRAPAPPQMENFRFEMTKVYSKIPPTPNEKLQIWDDQNLLWNTPSPQWKTSDLRWPKFTPKYPPSPMKNFRFQMTKVYSKIPPPPKKKKVACGSFRMWRHTDNILVEFIQIQWYSYWSKRLFEHETACVRDQDAIRQTIKTLVRDRSLKLISIHPLNSLKVSLHSRKTPLSYFLHNNRSHSIQGGCRFCSVLFLKQFTKISQPTKSNLMTTCLWVTCARLNLIFLLSWTSRKVEKTMKMT